MKFSLKKQDKKDKKEKESKSFIEMPSSIYPSEVDKTPRVINIKSGDYYDVIVGRESIFGNPFLIGVHGTRDEVINLFEDYLLSNHDLMQQVKEKLRGKVLACSCSPLKCHGDVLLKYANPELFQSNRIKLK